MHRMPCLSTLSVYVDLATSHVGDWGEVTAIAPGTFAQIEPHRHHEETCLQLQLWRKILLRQVSAIFHSEVGADDDSQRKVTKVRVCGH